MNREMDDRLPRGLCPVRECSWDTLDGLALGVDGRPVDSERITDLG
jgi:hypothetical protein